MTSSKVRKLLQSECPLFQILHEENLVCLVTSVDTGNVKPKLLL